LSNSQPFTCICVYLSEVSCLPLLRSDKFLSLDLHPRNWIVCRPPLFSQTLISRLSLVSRFRFSSPQISRTALPPWQILKMADLKPIKNPEIKFTQIFIDNEWKNSISGKVFPVIDPATENVICHIQEGDKRDIDQAVEVRFWIYILCCWKH
jgi:hypothetical protein